MEGAEPFYAGCDFWRTLTKFSAIFSGAPPRLKAHSPCALRRTSPRPAGVSLPDASVTSYNQSRALGPALWPSHNFRQLGDGSRYSPRFIAAKELHDQPASGVVFVIDVGQFLTASRFDDKAARQILH